jgi:hypothetical protein
MYLCTFVREVAQNRHLKSQSDDLEGADRAVLSGEDATKSPFESCDEADE